MMTTVGFVNRKIELNTVLEMVKNGRPRTILFYSKGGLGKTRLLEEIPEFLQNNQIDIICIDIVDFDDPDYRVVDNLVHILLDRLPNILEEDKDSVINELESLYHMERVGDSQKTRDEQGLRIIRQLAQLVNDISEREEKPTLLRFDTIEKMDANVQLAIAQFVKHLHGAFVVFSGRREAETLEFWPSLTKSPISLSEDVIEKKELLPFKAADREVYLHQKEQERHIKLSQQDVAQLLKLSDGRPILIDLAVEFFARSPQTLFDSQDVTEAAPSKGDTGLLDEELSKLSVEQAFERKLVNYVTAVRGEMERLILVLARVYPLSMDMVASMLNLPASKAAQLFDEAQTYVFIKSINGRNDEPRITLHDEMRRMVLAYVWDEVDPAYKRRQRDSRRARVMFASSDDSLRDSIRELKPLLKEAHSREIYSEFLTLERERQIVTEERLRHALYADFSAGFAEWQKLVNKIRFGRKYSFIYRLCQLVKPYINQDEKNLQLIPSNISMTEAQLFDYSFIEARALQDLGYFAEAEKRYLELFDGGDTAQNIARRRQIANVLGVLKRDQGLEEEALKYQQTCRNLLPEDNYWAIANVENQIGWLYRLMKDKDAKNLEPAREHFEEAIRFAQMAKSQTTDPEHKIQILTLIAAIQNNLGYIFSTWKQYDKAEWYCKQAIDLWERNGRIREIAWAKINLGVMARDQRQYQHAEQRLNEAITHLNPIDDFRELCQAYLQLGWTQWFMAEIDKNKESRIARLQEARTNLEKSLKHATDHDYNTELPDVYHQFASVLWSLGMEMDDADLRDKARTLNQHSIEWSRKLGNNRYFVDAWVGEMEFDLDVKDDRDIQKHLGILQPYQKYDFPLYFGRVERILGDWAYYIDDLDKAFEHYHKAIPLINSHGGYGPYKIEIELANLAEKLLQIPAEEAEAYLVILVADWKETKGRVDLAFWGERQQSQIQILD